MGSFSPYLEMFLSNTCVFIQALSLLSAFFPGVWGEGGSDVSDEDYLCVFLLFSTSGTYSHLPAGEEATGKVLVKECPA